jgi:hypothetical protein
MALDELAHLSGSCGWHIIDTLPGAMYPVVLEMVEL